MSISRSRLDRFIASACQINKKSVRLLVAQKRVTVDGVIATDVAQAIDKFSVVVMDEQILQANTACYIMLHKPVGVVCATKDNEHRTVLDLLPKKNYPDKDSLHIVGRLDLNTSGLVLLTNDSRWSERLMSPQYKVEKKYLVTLANPLNDKYIEAFAQGMYFAYENITTQPVRLSIVGKCRAEVTLTEGRYHQIKRMFGRFRNPVIALHRFAIGGLALEGQLTVGQSRMLSRDEVKGIFDKTCTKA